MGKEGVGREGGRECDRGRAGNEEEGMKRNGDGGSGERQVIRGGIERSGEGRSGGRRGMKGGKG